MAEKLYQDQEWLSRQYETKTTREIAELCHVDKATILRWLCRFGIPVRPACRRGNHIELSDGLREFLTGHLLGDGCLGETPTRCSAAFLLTSKYRHYAKFVATMADAVGLVGRVTKSCRYTYGNFRPYYYYKSRYYRELLSLRQEWYPNRLKHVLADILLTPSVVRDWYVDDGSLTIPEHNGHLPYITLSTHGFILSDVLALKQKLFDLGFKMSKNKRGKTGKGRQMWALRVSTVSTPEFFDYIGPCPEEIRECYGYKWEITR